MLKRNSSREINASTATIPTIPENYQAIEGFGQRRMSYNASVEQRLETRQSMNTLATQKVRYDPSGIKEANSQRISANKLKSDISNNQLQKPPKPY